VPVGGAVALAEVGREFLAVALVVADGVLVVLGRHHAIFLPNEGSVHETRDGSECHTGQDERDSGEDSTRHPFGAYSVGSGQASLRRLPSCESERSRSLTIPILGTWHQEVSKPCPLLPISKPKC
jgi:hypothetical protein